MHKRLIPVLVLACTVAVLVPATVSAQQTVNFSLGLFTPRGEDARVSGDVLNANRTFLFFDVSDFKSASIGGEWLVPFGEFFEGGAGIGFTRRTVPTVYTDFVDTDGSEIEQELRLRTVPFSFTVRALPLGQSNPFQPYLGVGLNVVNWRYSENGDFIDFNNNRNVFRDEFVGTGTATGGVALAGVRFQGRGAAAGFEVRYHKADSSFESDDDEFAGSKIDLGGWSYQGTIGFRF